MEGMRRTVIVTGMHRSGTSAVAGMLSAATEIEFGQVNRQYLADAPRGNYENVSVVDINEELIGGWKTPRVPRDVPRATLERIEATVAREYPYREGVIYGIKDPRFLFTLDVWRPYLGKLSILRVWRPPHQVMASLQRRELSIYGREMSDIEAGDIISRYMERHEALDDVADCVDFDATTLAQVAAWCERNDIRFHEQAAEAFYSRQLVHHR